MIYIFENWNYSFSENIIEIKNDKENFVFILFIIINNWIYIKNKKILKDEDIILEDFFFKYNIFISQYLLIFHIYSIIYNNKKNKDKILFIISYFNDILRKWAISILEDANHSLRKDFNIFKNILNIIYIDHNLK